MPTGYTCVVEDGSVTSFREFALRCSRAFGAMVTLREEPLSSELPEFKLEPYYLERVQRCEIDLGNALNMTEAEALEEAQIAFLHETERFAKYSEDKRVVRERYQKMIAKVESWEPPTSEHVELKNFMLQQLKDSIGGDSDLYLKGPKPCPSGQEWKAERVKHCSEWLAHARESLTNEEERVRSRNLWVKQLRDSLPTEEK